MPRQVFSFDPPERFVAGTVGLPGERAFYLQATGDGRTVTVALEKLQVRVLAERLDDLISTVERAGAAVGDTVEDNEPLHTPIEEEFRVGNMGLAWDGEADLCVIEAMAHHDDDSGGASDVEPLSDAEDGPDALRVRITAGMARGFVNRARRLLSAGRPPCPLCGLPLETDGHVCPRQNGHRR